MTTKRTISTVIRAPKLAPKSFGLDRTGHATRSFGAAVKSARQTFSIKSHTTGGVADPFRGSKP